jgi:hypothetical protein
MRSIRPEGAAGSRLRAFIEEFPSPAGGTNRYTQSEDHRATVACASYRRFCDLCRGLARGRVAGGPVNVVVATYCWGSTIHSRALPASAVGKARRIAAYANLPTPLGVARGDMCNRISFVPTGQAGHPVPDLSSVRQAPRPPARSTSRSECLAVRRCRRRHSAVRPSRRSTGCPSIRCLGG